MKDFLSILGMVLIVEGVPYFLAPERMRRWVLAIAELPEEMLRRTGFLLMAVGLWLVYLARG
ncbi:hypothetical protein SIID45300_02055 [Candidatus Magnetaquicoccaceae bacterium FCR-1]|uniref:DUF2065 domain-containing protein n=1 Tax=Candidatus Magnetaquiglobus chichijimensis TaxID=3141448 RepID=A0ABQ0CA04_9PROT